MAHRFSLSVAWDETLRTPDHILRYYVPVVSLTHGSVDDAAHFQAVLYSLNHPSNCSKVDALVMEGSNMLTGIGMIFYSHYLQALRIAYESNRVLVFANPILYYHYLSDRASLSEVYLLPPSNCSVEQLDKSRINEYSQAYKGHSFFTSFGRPKSPFSHRDSHWFRAQLVRYWLRFTPVLLKHFDNVSRAINFHSPCVGVHVRRGERGNVGFKTPWLANYPVYELSDAMSLVSHMAITQHVFLATDEPKFFREIKNHSTFNITVDNYFKRAENGRDCVREKIAGCTPGLTAATVTRTIWSELYFLSHCSSLVATMTSTFSKLAADYVLAYHENATILSLE